MPERRYTVLHAGAAGGARLSGRAAVNPALTSDEAFDVELFGRLLEARFGASEPIGDEAYAYSIRDQVTGIEFKAYSVRSGPSYAGSPPDCMMDFHNNDYRVKPEVLHALAQFEAWLCSPSDQDDGPK
jgi:hypothetical protein